MLYIREVFMPSEKTIFRCYANLFSTNKFQQLLVENDCSYALTKYKKYGVDDPSIATLGDFYKYAYKKLLKEYRNEYIYKNTIINKLLLAKYSLNTTTILNEFKIGRSIADLVLLNGTSKVFEIKTELDSLYRLESQIADYKKVFEHIYIVTHTHLADKLLKEIDDTVGIITLTGNGALQTIREAKKDTAHLDSSVIIKSLRKQEYSNIIQNYFGEIPQVTPVKYFSTCKEKFSEIPVKELHNLVVSELKKRTIKEKELFKSNIIVPPEFKYLFWIFNFKAEYYNQFEDLLDMQLEKA